MATKNLILRKYSKSLIISDIDDDNEAALNVVGLKGKKETLYLDKHGLESLKSYISYLIDKIERNENKSN